jgi:hypothetical protein
VERPGGASESGLSPAAAEAEHERRAKASKSARLVAIATFCIGAFMLFLVGVDTNEDNGVAYKVERKTVSTAGQPSSRETTRSTEMKSPEPDRSLVGRAFDDGPIGILLRLMLAALVAFALAALIQRVLLGEYGITIGPLALPALPAISLGTAKEVVDLIEESPEFTAILPAGPRGPQPHPQYMKIEDDRLALLSIRIELEERLRDLAAAAGVDEDAPLARLPGLLVDAGVFDYSAAKGLEKFIEVGDRVAKGAEVDPEAASKLRDRAFGLLYALAELRKRLMQREGSNA